MSEYNILNYYEELHCCTLKRQGTINTLIKVSLEPGINRLLAGPLTGKIMCVGFESNRPFSRQIHFVCILPGGYSQLIAMDAFRYLQTPEATKVAIGIVFTKLTRYGNSLNSFYFSVYVTEYVPPTPINLHRVAKKNRLMKLNYIPFYVTHAKVHKDDGSDPRKAFLVSGNDKKVHLYTEALNEEKEITFVESDIGKYFTELSDIPALVLSIHIKYLPEINKRLTAVGCQTGLVAVYHVDLSSNKVLKQFEFELTGPISSVRIFKHQSWEKDCSVPVWNLVASSAYDPVMVYKSAFERGFTDSCVLEGSDKYDCPCCCLVADVDFDGFNEILVGTYGQKLLVYKLKSSISGDYKMSFSSNETNQDSSNWSSPRRNFARRMMETFDGFRWTSSSSASPPPDDGMATTARSPPPVAKEDDFVIVSKRNFLEPVMALRYVKLNKGPLKELVVMTLTAVHIFRVHIDTAVDIVIKKVTSLSESDAELLQFDQGDSPPPHPAHDPMIDPSPQVSTGSDSDSDEDQA